MTTHDAPFSTADLFAYHKATGCPVMKAKAELLKMEDALRSRVLKAAHEQSGGGNGLHDPIENEPAMRELISAAATAARMLAGPAAGRGQGHRFRREQKRLLALQGVTWFSPAEMNPGLVFD